MPTKSPSSSSALAVGPIGRDAALIELAAAVLGAAQAQWPDRLIAEPDGRGHPVHLYTETHYALAAVLLSLLTGGDRSLLGLAAQRLRLWHAAGGPMFAFNAMAVCLVALVLRRSGERHQGLEDVLGELIGGARPYRDEVRAMDCGNNAYLQQVAVDMVLLPLARGETVRAESIDALASEFARYRTPEGFFYDLPREGTLQERLAPPTYIMKMVFLLGLCDELHPTPELEALFGGGMSAALPLLTGDGQLSYFGRTDNSPFAAGLTIFNLRKAARTARGETRYDEACRAAEAYYVSFPRTAGGLLHSNRFGSADSPDEFRWSRDGYAYVGQYSLASCAYALLGTHWFPAPAGTAAPPRRQSSAVAVSDDLGLVKLSAGGAALFLRTRGEVTAWDRRYLGPTILRLEDRNRLLVGAISRTVSTDAVTRPRAGGRASKAWQWLRHHFVDGIEQLDGTTVGFLPVLRRGRVDYLPSRLVAQESSPGCVRLRYEMVRVRARGVQPLWIDAVHRLSYRLPGLEPKRYTRPPVAAAPGLFLDRQVRFDESGCRIEDRVHGNLRGKRLIFSVRRLPGASVRVRGLTDTGSATGWGSDGRQSLSFFEAAAGDGEIRYECDIEVDARG